MRRALALVGAALVASCFSFTANAASATCNGGGGFGSIFVDITTTTGTPSCDSFGNGTVLNTLGDAKLSKVLDTTQVSVNGTPTLNVTFAPPILGVPNTDGTFTFNTAGFTNFFIGFQLNNQNIGFIPDPNPDWFVFSLAGITSGNGTFDADLHIVGPIDLTSDSIDYVVLYGETTTRGGNDSTTPVPGALWLFGSVLGGGLGFRRWRSRRK
jgi:hypothetical protein